MNKRKEQLINEIVGLQGSDADPSVYSCRVYYEDTDCLGMVYHANYLKYIERARTHHIEARAGQSLAALNDSGIVFVVRKMSLKFIRPARLGDQLEVTTSLRALPNRKQQYTRQLEQRISHNHTPIFVATVELACVNATGKLSTWPCETGTRVPKITTN